ncbi:MAG TPA: dipeptide epimerase [Terriglobales bacterium]|nr:dipeptide epimerase [Terriglobales bacterium]
MNRRDWLKSAGALGVAASLPVESFAMPATSGPAKIETEIKRLNLRHTWTTTMSSSEYRDTLHVRYTRDGITGYGEGAPIVRYKEDAKSAQAAVQSVHDLLANTHPWHVEELETEIWKRVPGEWAGKSAMDIALMDWLGKKLGIPLYQYFGLDPAKAPVTTFSIGMDKPEVVRQKVAEAEQFPVLKVKVGLSTDEEMIASVRSATKKPLRVDANEGWTNKEEAVKKINWLATQGVEFIEQPIPASMIGDIRWIRERVNIPIFADEACERPADVVKCANAGFDGVNIKLDKAGGVRAAYTAIKMAKALGLKTMLGCMISSSCTCTAAAHLSPLVDYADIDGPLLIANDPYRGVTVKDGKLVLPDGPGLGLKVL